MLLVYVILVGGAVVTITPLVWTLSTSLKTVQQLSECPPNGSQTRRPGVTTPTR